MAARRILASGLLGVAAVALASCASSSSGLIPTGDAGPLKEAFAEVEREARNGDGSCTATEAALATTEHDFAVLPPTVDAGLHKRLEEGISALRHDALKLCTQPLPQTTGTTNTSAGTTTSGTTAGPTQTTSTQTSSSATPPSGTGGGAPSTGGEAPPGSGAEQGGTGAGEGKGASGGKETPAGAGATEPGATGGGSEEPSAGGGLEGGK